MHPNNSKDPLFGAAVLKLTMIKKGLADEAGFRVVYAGTLRELKVSDAQVEAYIVKNRERLAEYINASFGKATSCAD